MTTTNKYSSIVWVILFLELFLECIIRPKNYAELIYSEKSYAPTTARNINSFHLFFEAVSLLLYIPEFFASFPGGRDDLIPFSFMWGSIQAVLGSTRLVSAAGRLCVGLRTLRMFGLIRHWKQMWINGAFQEENTKRNRISNIFIREDEFGIPRLRRLKFKNDGKDDIPGEEFPEQSKKIEGDSTDEDQRLKKAATIGTSLMVINSHRALSILLSIVTILPMIQSIYQVNNMTKRMTDLLQVNNINAALNCEELNLAVDSWLSGVGAIEYPTWTTENSTYVLYAQICPPRCNFQTGVITKSLTSSEDVSPCEEPHEQDPSIESLANEFNLRAGGIKEESRSFGDGEQNFSVKVFYNQNQTVASM